MSSTGVLERYYRELVGFLSARTGSRHTAEDIAHDAYLRVLERPGGQAIGHPRAFLYRTALNLITDHHRRNQVRRAEPLDVLDDHENQDCAPVVWIASALEERLELLQRALDELSEPCRQCFLLRKLEGLSHPQIAERLGVSKAMVEKHIVNAMKHCRSRLRDWA